MISWGFRGISCCASCLLAHCPGCYVACRSNSAIVTQSNPFLLSSFPLITPVHAATSHTNRHVTNGDLIFMLVVPHNTGPRKDCCSNATNWCLVKEKRASAISSQQSNAGWHWQRRIRSDHHDVSGGFVRRRIVETIELMPGWHLMRQVV